MARNARAPKNIPVYLELGSRRVFAGALDWPGWCRSGRDEDSALRTLAGYGPRYAAAVRRAAPGLRTPTEVSDFQVLHRLSGNATTDFGAPAVAPPSDRRPLDDAELERLGKLLRSCWAAFDAAARGASTAALRRGPRGGGRDLDAIRSHVLEAEAAYLARLGVRRRSAAAHVTSELARVRAAILDALVARAHGEPLEASRRTGVPWAPRYAVRRSAWHALDHAWEIEDRAMRGDAATN